MKRLRIEIKWAIIFIVVSLLWMLGEKLAGLHSTLIDKHSVFTNLFAIPAILIYFLAIRDKKLNYYHGKMRFMQGLWSGIYLSLIVTLFVPITQYITIHFITPEYFSNAVSYTVDSGQMTQIEAEKYFSLSHYIFISMISAPILGVVTSAFVCIFIRTKPGEY